MHMIDQSTGRAAIAYKNEVPWHGLGQRIPADATFDDWAKLGGIDYEVRRAPVMFAPTGFDRLTMPSRHVLYRNDTWHPLSVVGHKYNVVQPKQILETFRDLVEVSGFELETVGALSDGARVWALAKCAEGVIGKKDHVKRFLLAATSYDTTMSTIVKFVDERVVCHNTITSALGEGGRQFKIHHGKEFDAKEAKRFLDIGVSTWDQYLYDMNQLAQKEVTREQIEGTTVSLFRSLNTPADQDDEEDRIRKSKGFLRIMALFDKGIGSELHEGPSAWRWLNAVTQFVDWERGVTASSRMNSAWFGDGDAMKSRALKLVTA